MLIKQNDYEACQKFAEELDNQKSVYGFRRNQWSKERRIEQGTTGKCGEFAAYYFLKQYISIDKPSLTILKKAKWDIDLKGENKKFHVKTSPKHKNTNYDYSWTFQHGNAGKKVKGHRDPLLTKYVCPKTNDKNYIIFVQQKEDLEYEIVAIIPAYYLHKYDLLHFIDGVDIDRLKGIKKFVRKDGQKFNVPGLSDLDNFKVDGVILCL